MKATRKVRLGAIAVAVLLLCPFAFVCTKKGRDNPLDSHGQLISLNQTSLQFQAIPNGVLPDSQTFTITNTGGGTLNWSVSDNANWLIVSRTSGNSNSATITVRPNTTSLSLGTYNATIKVSSTNADNSPQYVSVTYIVSPPVPRISLSKTSMSFQAVQNGALPSSQTFTITNTGGGTLNWSVSVDSFSIWLDVSPTSGNSNSDTIMVSINTTNLSPSTYNATITVNSTNADNSPQYVSVTYTVSAPNPHISLNPTSLQFQAVQNGALPDSQTFTITNMVWVVDTIIIGADTVLDSTYVTGGGTLNWSVSNDSTWLDVSPPSGNSNSDTITVSVNTTNLTPSTYNATITVNSTNADNSPQTVGVTYVVAPAQAGHWQAGFRASSSFAESYGTWPGDITLLHNDVNAVFDSVQGGWSWKLPNPPAYISLSFNTDDFSRLDSIDVSYNARSGGQLGAYVDPLVNDSLRWNCQFLQLYWLWYGVSWTNLSSRIVPGQNTISIARTDSCYIDSPWTSTPFIRDVHIDAWGSQ